MAKLRQVLNSIRIRIIRYIILFLSLIFIVNHTRFHPLLDVALFLFHPPKF